MPAADPARPAFDLKSTAWTLAALRLGTADVAALADALDAQFADSPGLFDGEAVVLDFSLLRESDTTPDLHALLPHLQRHGMLPVAAQGGSPAQMAAARAAGLAEAADAAPARPDAPRSVVREVVREVAQDMVRDVVHKVAPDVPAEVVRAQPAATSADTPAAAEPAAPAQPVPPLVIDKPLRSGQRIYARGGDLIVLAVVSFGAEVIADGNIHVYAPLRGRAIAGARGDATARIYCTCLEPQLVSIAGIYRTTETPLADEVLGKPALVRLDGEKIIVEPLAS